MQKKLRLLFTEKCNRSCPGCCNKNWNLDKLEKVSHYNYDEILITGGEPLLYPDKLIELIQKIRHISNAKIYVYTAHTSMGFFKVLRFIDGITLTLHTQDDVLPFTMVNTAINNSDVYKNKSLRLNVFKGISYPNAPLWIVKDNMEWIKDCPLPEDEVFLRI